MDLFYLDPRGFNVQDLNTGIASVQVTRPGGQPLTVDAAGAAPQILQEHPPVERMEGDLGAICQVFKESSNYYLSLPGVALAPGDRVTLAYDHRSYTVTLRVVELEQGRCRIDPPLVDRSAMRRKYTRIYCDENQVSHFRDGEIAMDERFIGPGIPPLGASAQFPASSYYVLTFPPGMVADWHPAPGRLFHFFLAGQCQVTVGDGEVRVFQAGDMVLAEDTAGKGHITRNDGPVETLMVVVALPDKEEAGDI